MKTRAAFVLLAVVATTAIGQYKYTTSDGRTVYSDQPPPTGARNVQQRDFAGDAATLDTARMPYELRRAVESFPVTLYTTPNSPACDAGRALLNKRGVPFTEKTVRTADDLRAVTSKQIGNSFPVIVIGTGKHVGFDEANWISALDIAGYPKNPPPPGSYRNPAPIAAAPPKAPAAQSKETAEAAPAEVPAARQPASSSPANPAGIRF